jgi:tetratricopeptide (TPR) repeat protein
MEEREILNQALKKAHRTLAILQDQAAGYSSKALPVHLRLELEDKRQEVTNLENQLARPTSEPVLDSVMDTLNREIRLQQTSSRRLRLFLCHSEMDKETVRALYRRLLLDGWIKPWLDEEDILPGHDWRLETTQALKQSDVVLICLSKQALSSSGSFQKLLRQALDVASEQPEGTIFIIPLKFQECALPESLKPFHAVNFFEQPGYTRLMKALELRALELGIQKVRQVPTGLIDTRLVQIEKAETEGNWDTVIRVGKQIIESDLGRRSTRHKMATAYFERGKGYYNEGNYQLAAAEFEQASEMEPAQAVYYFEAGSAYLQTGNNEKAIEKFSRAIKLQPDYGVSFYLRGKAYQAKDDQEAASKDFEQAAALGLSEAKSELQQARLLKNIEELKQAEDRHDWQEIIKLGVQLAGSANQKQAIEKVLVKAYYQRAIEHAIQKNFVAAIEDFSRAVDLEPGNAEIYFQRGLAQLGLNKSHEALSDFNRAIEKGAQKTDYFFWKGKVLKQIGDTKGARQEFEKAAALGLTAAREELKKLEQERQEEGRLRLEAEVESTRSDVQKVAAEKLLSQRLAHMVQLNQKVWGAQKFLSNAEYQLFLEEMHQQSKYFQPYHWRNLRFAAGYGLKPVTGITAEDAQAFCDWLTTRNKDGNVYRLPKLEELRRSSAVIKSENATATFGTWAMTGNRISLIWTDKQSEEITKHELMRAVNSVLPLPTLENLSPELALNRSSNYDYVLKPDLSQALSFFTGRSNYLALDLDFALDIVLSRNVGTDLSLANHRAVVRAKELAREFNDISTTLNKGDGAKALQLAQSYESNGSSLREQKLTLLKELLTTIEAKDNAEAKQSWRKYAAKILEYACRGYEELVKAEKVRARELESDKKDLLNLYWWLETVIAMFEGQFTGTDGVILVRESK